jgi:hypothetical protein
MKVVPPVSSRAPPTLRRAGTPERSHDGRLIRERPPFRGRPKPGTIRGARSDPRAPTPMFRRTGARNKFATAVLLRECRGHIAAAGAENELVAAVSSTSAGALVAASRNPGTKSWRPAHPRAPPPFRGGPKPGTNSRRPVSSASAYAHVPARRSQERNSRRPASSASAAAGTCLRQKCSWLYYRETPMRREGLRQ